MHACTAHGPLLPWLYQSILILSPPQHSAYFLSNYTRTWVFAVIVPGSNLSLLLRPVLRTPSLEQA